MEEWQASASELIPLEHPKKNKPATLCQASTTLGCTWSSFPSKIPYHPGKHRQLHTIIKASSRKKRARESRRLPV